ncbi:MAG: HDOD domain-containing protein [Fibrobacter sp.]|nr:HDOD domain-containing protein [Fibrobacter sp.]
MEINKNIQQSLLNISSLPTLPTVIESITRLLQNPKTSAEEIGKAITTDQALTAKVLKLVNSAFYGFPGRISTITHAIVILGFSTVKNIVLTASIFEAFKSSDNAVCGFDLEQFWTHSIACGAASHALARIMGNKEKEECFIGGLIHDIGKLILYKYYPEEFSSVLTYANTEDILFYEGEKKFLDITHEEIGSYIAQRWKLPSKLQSSVKNHHNPLPVYDNYINTGIVHCADIFVRALDYGNGGDKKIPLLSENVWTDLELENRSLVSIFDTIQDEVEKATEFIYLI